MVKNCNQCDNMRGIVKHWCLAGYKINYELNNNCGGYKRYEWSNQNRNDSTKLSKEPSREDEKRS